MLFHNFICLFQKSLSFYRFIHRPNWLRRGNRLVIGPLPFGEGLVRGQHGIYTAVVPLHTLPSTIYYLYACDTECFESSLCRMQTVKVSSLHLLYMLLTQPRLKCDRNVPCNACTRRGCPSICPEGKLVAGKGTRFAFLYRA
jgi:hypothetical protein